MMDAYGDSPTPASLLFFSFNSFASTEYEIPLSEGTFIDFYDTWSISSALGCDLPKTKDEDLSKS